MISYEDFKKVDLRVAKIIEAEKIEGSDKLLKLQIDLGPPKFSSGKLEQVNSEKEIRQLVAGIGKSYKREDLVGKEIIVVVNLEPKKVFGAESQGMLLAADGEEPILIVPDKEVPPGSRIL